MKKAVSGIMLTLLILTSTLTLAFNIQPAKGEPTIIIVPDDYPTIQEALNNANEGDTIFVKAGIYYEHVVINKSVSLIGENRETTIIDGGGPAYYPIIRYPITVKANNVVIEGFTIRNSEMDRDGIYVFLVNHTIIRNNKITANSWAGIFIQNSFNNTISGNDIINNGEGIVVVISSNTTISGNNITANKYAGIDLQDSSNNTLRNNYMSGNGYNFYVWGEELSHFIHDVDPSNTVGGKPIYYWVNQQNLMVPTNAGQVLLVNSINITVRNLDLKNNGQGILLAYTQDSLITGNNLTNNVYGIWLYYSSQNTISTNIIANNEVGISFEGYSSYNNISGNNIANNYDGIDLISSSNNMIYHNNFVNNPNQVYSDDVSANIWDDGYPSGGNYWSDYAGVDEKSGPNQDQLGSDGIGDTPYIIDENNQDRYPLMNPYAELPVHNINTGEDFLTIQSAIDDSDTQGGHIITVDPGIYYENIHVTKSLTIKSTSGDPTNTIIMAKNPDYAIFSIGILNYVNISGFTIKGATEWAGIALGFASNCIISNNIVSDNYVGILLSYAMFDSYIIGGSKNNTIASNEIRANEFGIVLEYDSYHNKIYYNNFIDNAQQTDVYPFDCANFWDNGYPSGGNYWSDYTDVDLYSGPCQNETGGDGIWDHPYVIDENNTDRYPLVNPWTPTPTYVQGIDVSHWQGDINWSEVYGAGYRFAFVKASEGVGWMDSNFVTNMDNGSDAGLLMGAYHFARPDLGNNAQDEALYFVSVARNYLKGGYLRPALDLEVGSSLGKEALSNWVHTWMETVKNETGIEPIIYVNSNYANNYLNTSVAKYDLWIAHWTYDPTTSPNTGIWSSWDFWQYSNNGSVSGISGDVDLDIFNGDMYRLYDAFANHPPVANFIYLPTEPKAGEKVTFNASSSYDQDGEIISYEWDWNGDGDYDDYTSSPTTTFWWMEDGKYNVSLRVIDDKGAVNTTSKEITISKSPTSKVVVVLAAWWTSWPWEWPRRLRDHNDFVDIDRWLREFEPESKPLDWLKGTKFASCTEADIVYILNKEIDPSQAPGLTYKIHTLNTIYEEELVHEAFWNSISPEAYYYGAKLIGELLVDSVSGLPTKIAEQAILDLSPTLGTGVSTLLLVLKVHDVINTFKKIEKVEYTWALGVYFWNRRSGENVEDAWNHQTSSLVEATINPRASEEERQEILLATKWYFEELWSEYEGHGREKTGLYSEFRKNIRDKIKSLLISALEKYKNELPNRETARIASPGELRVYDSEGRVTGVIKGEVREEIPNSVYDDETKTVKIFWPSDSYKYEVQGTGEGTYGLEITSAENGQIVNFTATDIPTSITAIHEYTINWTALSRDEKGVTVQVDSDGDSIFEYAFTSDSELTHDEFVQQTSPTYVLTIITTAGGTTDPAPGTYAYTANSSVQVTAIPNADYTFDHWELDTINVGSANPYTVLMDNNHTLNAVFTYAPPPPPLSVSISPLSASILVGQSVTFTSTVSGGYTPYSYQWYLNGAPVSGATSNTWAFTPTTSGIYYIYLKVTDAKGNTAQSGTARITAQTVPVGGYSISIQLPATAKPVTMHIALLTILTAIFITIKRKTKRKH